LDEQTNLVTENQTQEQNQLPTPEERQGFVYPNSGQIFSGPCVQWVPIQVQPIPGQTSQMNSTQSSTSFAERINGGQGGGNPQLNNESNSGGMGWPFLSQTGSGTSGFGANPYLTYGIGFLLFAGIIAIRIKS